MLSYSLILACCSAVNLSLCSTCGHYPGDSLGLHPASQHRYPGPSLLAILSPAALVVVHQSPLNLTNTSVLGQEHSSEHQSCEVVCTQGFYEQIGLGNAANITSYRLLKACNVHKTH